MKGETTGMKRGFTLIELLVVVAIIAVIGAGVAVSYNRLDERAKVAMEINDCGTLKRIISHWSMLKSTSEMFNLPDRLDSLIDVDGSLYSIEENGSSGLYLESAYTLEAASAPDRVIDNLVNAGLSTVYMHLLSRSPANDSTFTTGLNDSDVNTAATEASLEAGNSDARTAAQTLLATEDDGLWWDYDSDGPFTVDGTSYSTLAEYQQALRDARSVLEGNEIDKLAFIYPGGGATISGESAFGNNTYGIIADVGLTPDEVARPDEDASTAAANNRTCWLVAFGLGRFSTIYEGKGARADAPATGKRYSNSDNYYSRYILLVKVPVTAYSGHTGTGEMPQVLAVLSPQCLTTAMLSDLYRDEVNATNN